MSETNIARLTRLVMNARKHLLRQDMKRHTAQYELTLPAG